MAKQATGITLQTIYRRTSIALAFASCLSMFAVGAAPANALTLMDFIRGGPGKRDNRPDARMPDTFRNQVPQGGEVVTKALPKVTGPRYYTYKPDATRIVKTEGFAAADAVGSVRLLAMASVVAPVEVAAALEGFYNKNEKPVWVANGDINDKARRVLAVFKRAGDFGLDPNDYLLPVPELTTASTRALPVSTSDTALTDVAGNFDQQLMQFELAMSAKVLTYAQDMVRGRIDPNRISGYHDFKRKDVRLDFVLPFARADDDAGAYLEGLAPTGTQFLALKKELATIRADMSNEDERIVIADNLLLKPGNSNTAVADVVAAIRKNASKALKTGFAETFASYDNSDVYGPALVELVKAFQKEEGLKPDGIVGRATVHALVGDSDEAKVEKLIVAMEQARWLPNDLGDRYVFINQPAYMAYYHDKGAEAFSMRVVVGSKANQTYFFQDVLETVEFNPYWGVPQSIIINEMLPKLRADPSYLDRMGYQVEVNGRPVSSTNVNWYGSTKSIAVRQPPSSDNALGELKILFPNAHAIYMHDTPSKSYFKRDIRALSHGCIRLADPRRMAAAVLGFTEQEVAARIAAGKNSGERITARIPVYVSYFTAWPNKDGVVEYFADVYDRDAATLKAMKATSKSRSA